MELPLISAFVSRLKMCGTIEAEVDDGGCYISYDERGVRRSLVKREINTLIFFISHA